jgi:hypothetical protein
VLRGVPPTTPNFIWCSCLLELLSTLEEVLQIAVQEIFTDPEIKRSMVNMTEVKTDVSGTMRMKIGEWASGIRDDYKDRVQTALISSNAKTRILSMNFDPELYLLLQEIHFLSRHLLGNIHPVAMEIYQESQFYNDYIHNIKVLTERHNYPVCLIVDVERRMFQKHIWHVDELLRRGITELTWEGEGALAFLNESVEEISRSTELRNTPISNITMIKTMIESSGEPPLFSRLDPKRSCDQNEGNNTLNAQIALIAQQSQEISQLIKSSVDKLTDNSDSPETHQYLKYIASLIREGFTGNIMYSFDALLEDLSVKQLEQGSVQRLNIVNLITTD